MSTATDRHSALPKSCHGMISKLCEGQILSHQILEGTTTTTVAIPTEKAHSDNRCLYPGVQLLYNLTQGDQQRSKANNKAH